MREVVVVGGHMTWRGQPHPEEERELPAVEAHPEKLGLDPLLLDDVVVVRRLHFLSPGDKSGDEENKHPLMHQTPPPNLSPM